MAVQCPFCFSTNVSNVSPYKVSSEAHRATSICSFLYLCADCRLGFAHPMPSADNLRYFYRNVYRSGFLNPYRINFPQWIEYSAWADSQLALIEKEVDSMLTPPLEAENL